MTGRWKFPHRPYEIPKDGKPTLIPSESRGKSSFRSKDIIITQSHSTTHNFVEKLQPYLDQGWRRHGDPYKAILDTGVGKLIVTKQTITKEE